MKYLINTILLGLAGFSMLIGCSPVGFDVSQKSCEEINAETCIVPSANIQTITDSYTVTEPVVDILFVVDNSGSMATEQERMGQSFNNFVYQLNQDNVDWQLGITTSDISVAKRSQLGDQPYLNYPQSYYNNTFNSDYQDGKLLNFSAGKNILRKGDFNSGVLFQSTVQIQQAGTWDERGILAAGLALERNNGSLIRFNSNHVAVVILSDEDVRSIGEESLSAPYNGIASIKHQDTKEHLANVWNNISGGNKGISVHSVVIREGDISCHASQNAQALETAEYGRMYQDLSNDPRFKGVVGDVCASSYTSQLSNMGDFIANRTLKDVSIASCDQYITNDSEYPFEITITKSSGQYSFLLEDTPPSNSGVTNVELSAGRLSFTPALPAGTTVDVKFSCEI